MRWELAGAGSFTYVIKCGIMSISVFDKNLLKRKAVELVYILQMADFHISKDSDINSIKRKFRKLGDALANHIVQGTGIVCCLLGDFIEKGEPDAYLNATEVLKYFVSSLTEIIGNEFFSLEILPGNHDLCPNSEINSRDFTQFNAFASNLLGEDVEYSDAHFFRCSEHFGYKFICLNTTINQEIEYGQVDFSKLSEQAISKNTIILSHHALISGDPGDCAAIRDGYQLVKLLEDSNAIGLLHGHTHGCKRFTVGNDSQVIGVGPILKQEIDISNQCNLISVSGDSIKRITTFTYHGDRDTWDCVTTYEKQEDNNYTGNSVYDVYCSIQKNIDETSLLNNFRLLVRQKYELFEKEIVENFDAYREEASDWQENIPNDRLHYTHAQLMNLEGKSWLEFIVNTLKTNSTSKRAIIPLLTKDAVYEGGDDYLVSFDVVQFGFESDIRKTLQVTVYLRALELFHFLPINLYEIYIMASKLKIAFPTIENIEICMTSFRAEAKKEYNCYRKCDIDFMSESRICRILEKESIDSFKNLLFEKAGTRETVINFIWLDKLSNVIKDYYESEDSSDFRQRILEQIETIRTLLTELKEIRLRSSIYSLTTPQEEKISAEIFVLAEMFH